MILATICARPLIQAILSGKQLRGGDIKTNRGPAYQKIVQGAFHLENRQLFGETVGI